MHDWHCGDGEKRTQEGMMPIWNANILSTWSQRLEIDGGVHSASILERINRKSQRTG